MSVKITGLTIIANPVPNKSGFSVLCWFNVIANGIGLDGCAFMVRNGMFHISPPLVVDDAHKKRISISDPDLRDEILGSIRLAYIGLGGVLPVTKADAVVVPLAKVPRVETSGQLAAVEPETEGLARFMKGAA